MVHLITTTIYRYLEEREEEGVRRRRRKRRRRIPEVTSPELLRLLKVPVSTKQSTFPPL